MEFIQGEERDQIILFPESIDEYIGEESSVRVIEAYIDNLELANLSFTRFQPKETGRPPYDPKDLLKLYVYGYLNKVRSSRRLEKESKRNLEVLWLLKKLSPDHKTIASFRKDNSEALTNVFRDFTKLCIKLGLYGKELIAVDGSKFKAVNSRARNFTKEKLKDRLERIEKKIAAYLGGLEETDRVEDAAEKEKTAEEIKKIVYGLTKRKENYQGYADELEKTGETQKSLTDSESRLMMANGKMEVCYNVQTAVDAENKLIAAFSVTNNVSDFNQITPMAQQAKEALEIETIAVVADKGYDSAADIAAAIQIGVEPHVAGTDYAMCVPVAAGEETEITSHRDGKSAYVAGRNIALCPMGKVLYPGYYKKSDKKAVFYNSQACKECTCKCTKTPTYRYRYYYQMAESDFTKEYDDKELFVKQVHVKSDKALYVQRKSIVEHPFGTIKRAMDGAYCLMKGKKNVSGEFALMFLAYNLKRVINILGAKKLIEKMA